MSGSLRCLLSRGAAAVAIGAATLTGISSALSARAADSVTFTVLIEGITGPATLALPDGGTTSAPISPGLFLVSADDGALFEAGTAAGGTALERLAEDGDASALIAGLNASGVTMATAFLHDESFVVTARPGDRLHFAVMFVQSNDLFYAADPAGIALFDPTGVPITGDRTAAVKLWDAGTEVNQPPGVGTEQAPRQGMPDTGAAEDGTVRLVDDGFGYPASTDVIRVTITPQQ